MSTLPSSRLLDREVHRRGDLSVAHLTAIRALLDLQIAQGVGVGGEVVLRRMLDRERVEDADHDAVSARVDASEVDVIVVNGNLRLPVAVQADVDGTTPVVAVGGLLVEDAVSARVPIE